MSFRLISGLAAIALVVLSGAFLYAVAGYFAVEERRLARDASAAAEAVSAVLDRPAAEISRALSDSTLTSLAEVERRVTDWAARSEAQTVIRDVHVFDADSGESAATASKEALDPSLASWTQIIAKASENLGVLAAVPAALDAAQPALVVPVAYLQPDPAALGETGLAGVALVRFDVEALAQDYARASLRGQVDLETTFEVRIQPRTTGWDDSWRPDAVRNVAISRPGAVALLAPPPAVKILSSSGVERSLPPSLSLGVRYREGSAADRFATIKRSGFAFSWLVVGLVTASLMLTLVTARRALDFRAAQMHFVAGISHELRTPIAVIDAAAQNLRDQIISSPDGVQEYGGLIQQHASRLRALVERTLTFAETRAGHAFQNREHVDVSAVIRDVSQVFEATAAAPRVRTEVPHALPQLHADPYGVRVLIENVVSNALKYSDDEVMVTAGVSDTGLWVRVVDRGPGIPKSERRRVFEPFFRGRTGKESAVGGSGLGLGLVRAVADSHGATVKLGATPGGGTTVTVVFPTASLR